MDRNRKRMELSNFMEDTSNLWSMYWHFYVIPFFQTNLQRWLLLLPKNTNKKDENPKSKSSFCQCPLIWKLYKDEKFQNIISSMLVQNIFEFWSNLPLFQISCSKVQFISKKTMLPQIVISFYEFRFRWNLKSFSWIRIHLP